MYTIKVGEKTFDILVKGKVVEVNGKALDFDLVQLDEYRHLKHHSYRRRYCL